MTRAQYQSYNRLAAKQVNRRFDVVIVEESASSVTFFAMFPGLYLTYDRLGKLIVTETARQREIKRKPMASQTQQQLTFGGELGS